VEGIESYKPKRVGVLNCENRVLPFSNQKLFSTAMLRAYKTTKRKLSNGTMAVDSIGKPIIDNGFIETFEAMVADDNIDAIVVESFTRVTELLEDYISDVLKKEGYDYWGYYLDELKRVLLVLSANCKKPIIWTALPEIMYDDQNKKVERVAVSGKLKNKIESYFDVVVWCVVDNSAKTMKDRYKFMLRSDGKNSAKTPMEILPNEMFMENDVNLLLHHIRKQFGVSIDDKEFHYPKILICAPSGTGKSTSLRNLVKE